MSYSGYVRVFDINNCKFPTFKWLDSIPIYNNNSKVNKGLFSFIKEKQYNEYVWTLFQMSIPPLFAGKYHKIDKSNENFEQDKPIIVASSLLMWNQCLGLPLLNIVYKTSTCKNTNVKQWLEQCKCTLQLLGDTVRSDEGILINDSDLCSKSSEFLLENCVLMQLPFKPMLLHQWLLTALSEVLVFELETQEFKHWSLNTEILSIVKNIFNLVRQLKERIMFGFSILNEQITSYPNVNFKHPHLILDTVIIPSIPILEFLCNGTAIKYINQLKSIAFNVQSKSYLPYEIFYLDFQLAKLHCNFAYNFPIWSTSNISNLYPKVTDNIGDINQRLNINKRQVPVYSKPIFDITSKVMSQEEKYLFGIVEKNVKAMKMNGEEKIKLTIQTIKEFILNKLVGISAEDLETRFSTSRVKRQAAEIFDERKTDNIHHALRQTLMYHEICKLLTDSDKETSISAQIITLQLHILKKEQLARLTNTCTLIFKSEEKIQEITTQLEDVSIENQTSILISSEVEKIIEKVKNQSRDLFWLQYPEEWKKDVKVEEKIINDSDTCFKHMLIKVARINYSVTQHSFNITNKNDVAFLYWHYSHYMLPVLIHELKSKCKDNAENILFIPFVISLVSSMEVAFLTWSKNIKNPLCPLFENTRKIKANDKAFATSNVPDISIIACIRMIDNDIHRLLSKFTVIANSAHFRYMLEYIMGAFQTLNIKILVNGPCLFPQMYSIVNQWCKYNHDFVVMMYIHCNKNFDVLIPGTKIEKYPILGELYYAMIAIADIVTVYGLETTIKDDDEEIMERHLDSSVRDYSMKIYHKIVLYQIDMYVNDNVFIQDCIQFLHRLYIKLKQFRRRNGRIQNSHIDAIPNRMLYPQVAVAIDSYIEGNFTALDSLLTIFNHVKTERVKEEEKERMCKQCGKPDSARKLFACEKCVEVNFPCVDYYCGRRCQETRWKSEHKAEHLEFELGLLF